MGSCWHGLPFCKGTQLRDAGWRDWGAWEEGKYPFRLGAAEGRAAPAKPEAQVSGHSGQQQGVTELLLSGGWGDEGRWQCATSFEQKAQEGKGCMEEPQDQALPPPVQCSV